MSQSGRRSKSANNMDAVLNGALPSVARQLKCPLCQKSSKAIEFLPTKGAKGSKVEELKAKLEFLDSMRKELKQMIEEESNGTGVSSKLGSPTFPGRGKSASLRNVYDIDNLDESGKRALQLLTTHDAVVFKVNGLCITTNQAASNERPMVQIQKWMRQFQGQDFMVGVQANYRLFVVQSKASGGRSQKKDKMDKQYRQARAFATLSGVHIESAKDNILRVWFSNSTGYFLISFASEAESRMILNICKIIINNSDYHQSLENQVMWSGYAQKKGKRMGLKKMCFILLRGQYCELYRSHKNYDNGEEPSHKFSLLSCDFSQKRSDGREVRFRKKDVKPQRGKDDDVFLTVSFFGETERDDFLSICASVLRDSIAKQKNIPQMSLKPRSSALQDMEKMKLELGDLKMEDSDSDSEDDEKYASNDYDSDYNTPTYDPNDIHTTATPGFPNRSFPASTPGAERPVQTPGGFFHGDQSILRTHSFRTVAGPTSFYQSAQQLQLVSDQLVEKRSQKHQRYLEELAKTPRMYGASHIKALNRLAKKRASDIDFIEETFTGMETKLLVQQDEYLQTYKLLDVIGQSIVSGAFLNRTLFIHKAVWNQNKVMLLHYEDKIEIFTSILGGLDKAFTEVDIVWLQKDNFKNVDTFHLRLLDCEETMKQAQQRLRTFAVKEVVKSKKKGVGRFFSNLKDKSQGKVFDNSTYRTLIQRICAHSSKMETYYKYLSSGKIHASQGHLLMLDLQNITKCMVSFTQVVFADIKEFVKAYLKRGAKNLYA